MGSGRGKKLFLPNIVEEKRVVFRLLLDLAYNFYT